MKTRITFDSYIGEDTKALVTADYYPPDPGRMYEKNGDPGEPPTPAEVDLIFVVVDGRKIDLDILTPAEVERLSSQAEEQAEPQYRVHELE